MEPKKLVVCVNTKEPNNQYAALAVAFTAKKVYGVPSVTVFYGAVSVGITRKGKLAEYALSEYIRTLIASQFDGLEPGDLPDSLEQLAKYLNTELGVEFCSCGTFNAMQELVNSVEKVRDIEPFIKALKIPDAVGMLANADKIVYF
ncbi:MAG: hypothetical protein WBC21_01550 [Minisyncoccales bacterium]